MSRTFRIQVATVLLVASLAFAHPQISLGDEPAEAAIRRALAQTVKVDLNETPLSKALQGFTDGKLDLLIDRKALADAGLELNTPVTAKAANVSLQKALKMILSDFELVS